MSIRILVADDNHDGAETMGMLLEISGHEVHLAHSGMAAFDAAKQMKPNVAILDIGMPDLDGYEVARRIKQETWGKSMRLIAVTGWGQAEDKRRAIAAGFDHHLTKPIDPDELERLIVSETPSPDPAQTIPEPDVDESDEGPGFLAILEEEDVANPAPPAAPVKR